MNESGVVKVIVGLAFAFLVSIVMLWMVDGYTIEGNQVGVEESWGDGVNSQTLRRRTNRKILGFQ